MWKMMHSLENYKQYSEHQYYLLTWCCKKAVSRAENCGGIGLEKGRKVAWKSLKSCWFYFLENSGHPVGKPGKKAIEMVVCMYVCRLHATWILEMETGDNLFSVKCWTSDVKHDLLYEHLFKDGKVNLTQHGWVSVWV